MRWTTELPQAEGWYLYRNDHLHTEHAYYVSTAPKGGFYIGSARGSKGQRLKPEAGALWAGPIPEPAPYDGPELPNESEQNPFRHICKACGKEFFGMKGAIYCSRKCWEAVDEARR